MPEPQTGSATGAQGATGGNANTDTAQGAGAAVAARAGADTSSKRAETSAIAERFLAKYGTYERAIEVMAGEHYEYREAARKDAETIGTLQRNQVPKDAVVLTGDDVKHWEKVKATGVAIDKIAPTLERAKVLEAERVKLERATKHADVAKAAMLDKDVLSPLLEQFGFDVDTRVVKVQQGDKLVDQQQAIIRKAGDDKAVWEPLSEFIAKDGSPLKPFGVALKLKGNANNNGGSAANGNASGAQGATTHAFADAFGTSGDAGNGGGGDFVTNRIKTQNSAADKRTNPLRPATGKTT